MNNQKPFKLTPNSGFHLTFPNGVTASVQWGVGRYADNYGMIGSTPLQQKGSIMSTTAECCAWTVYCTPDGQRKTNYIIGELYPAGDVDDIVQGYMSALDVVDFLNRCAGYVAHEHSVEE